MTVIYRTAGAWGAGLGANLTPANVDGNFWDHDSRIEALEDHTGEGVGISTFTISGNQLTVVMTDSTTRGPFALPSATWDFRGPWQPLTTYLALDVVTALTGLYLVTYPHTSASAFDPNANDGLGHNYYSPLIEFPPVPVLTVTVATFTPGLSYANSYIRMTNVSGCAVTIPNDATLNFAIGTELHFRAVANPSVTFEPMSGCFINFPEGYLNSIAVIGGTVTLKKVAADEWDAFGLLGLH
jgi:hypothetical protein